MLHGARSYVLCDDDGQIVEAHSITAGLDYPGVGPEHSFLKDSGRATYLSRDRRRGAGGLSAARPHRGDPLRARERARDRGAAGGGATLPDGAVMIVNVSGRGDKDMGTISKRLGVTL